jgi:hypothetical protein
MISFCFFQPSSTDSFNFKPFSVKLIHGAAQSMSAAGVHAHNNKVINDRGMFFLFVDL